ncbi:hypothetical protein Peur_005186 [Populus x canadensis]
MVVQDLVCNYARVYLTLKNQLKMNLEEVGENKVMAEEKLNLEEVSRDVEKTYLNDSMRTGPNSIEKGDGKEQDCNLGRILEPDCVFVEFRRAEASCMAGHCLHGKKKKKTIATAAVGGGVLLGNNTRFLKTQQFSISKPSPVSVSEIGFLTSQLGGIRISYNPPKPLTAPFTPAIQPLVARRICPFTGKKANRANKVSFSNHKTKKLQFVNLQYKRLWWEAGKRYVKLRLSTKALKTIQKNGLDAVAKKAGIDLRKE